MAYRKVKDLAVVTGTYQSNGETKNRYQNVGVVMEGGDGKQFLMLNRSFNPAGVPFKEGSESILVSMFDPREQGQTQQQSSGGGRGNSAPSRGGFGDDLDDRVPFLSWDDDQMRRVM